MDRKRKELLTAQVTEILNRRGLLNKENQFMVHEIVNELGKVIYDSLNRKVPYEVCQAIWKKYNSDGGWSINELAKMYSLSVKTISLIIHNKYL